MSTRWTASAPTSVRWRQSMSPLTLPFHDPVCSAPAQEGSGCLCSGGLLQQLLPDLHSLCSRRTSGAPWPAPGARLLRLIVTCAEHVVQAGARLQAQGRCGIHPSHACRRRGMPVHTWPRSSWPTGAERAAGRVQARGPCGRSSSRTCRRRGRARQRTRRCLAAGRLGRRMRSAPCCCGEGGCHDTLHAACQPHRRCPAAGQPCPRIRNTAWCCCKGHAQTLKPDPFHNITWNVSWHFQTECFRTDLLELEGSPASHAGGFQYAWTGTPRKQHFSAAQSQFCALGECPVGRRAHGAHLWQCR